MPQSRCFGGSVRQASAITTALSPDRMMLTQMILKRRDPERRVREVLPQEIHRLPLFTAAGVRRRLPLSSRPSRGLVIIYRRTCRLDQRPAVAKRRGDQPTISLPAKNWAISFAAVSGASEPCTEFSPIDLAWTLRMVPARPWPGRLRP